MPEEYDPDLPVSFDTALPTEEFVQYLNRYAGKVRQNSAVIRSGSLGLLRSFFLVFFDLPLVLFRKLLHIHPPQKDDRECKGDHIHCQIDKDRKIHLDHSSIRHGRRGERQVFPPAGLFFHSPPIF